MYTSPHPTEVPEPPPASHLGDWQAATGLVAMGAWLSREERGAPAPLPSTTHEDATEEAVMVELAAQVTHSGEHPASAPRALHACRPPSCDLRMSMRAT